MELSRIQKFGLGLGISAISLIFIVVQLSNFSRDTSLNNWAQGFEGYVKTSRLQADTGKPMAVFFYTDWCTSCKQLREEILSSPEVSEYMANVHPVKVNPESDVLENRLAQEFGVIGYPSFFIVDAGTDKIKPIRRTANITPEQFVAQLEAAAATL